MMPKTDGMPDCGYCRFNQLEILIKQRMRLSKTQEVLLHEIQHACTYPDLIGKRATDEEFIDHTAPKLLEVLKENPALVKYLTR
jgi:hypothetical protein